MTVQVKVPVKYPARVAGESPVRITRTGADVSIGLDDDWVDQVIEASDAYIKKLSGTINSRMVESDGRNIQRAYDEMKAEGIRHFVLEDDGLGTFYFDRIDLPDFSAPTVAPTNDEKEWNITPSASFVGVRQPMLTQLSAGHPYMIGHPGVYGTSTYRNRNWFPKVSGLKLLGLGFLASPRTDGIAFSNAYYGEITDNMIGGVRDAVVLYGFKAGGNWQCRVERNLGWPQRTDGFFDAGLPNGSNGIYNLGYYYRYGVDNFVRCVGWRNGTGKSSDHYIVNNRTEFNRRFFVSTEGLGPAVGTLLNPTDPPEDWVYSNGGSDNIHVLDNWAANDPLVNLEIGKVDEVISTTEFYLDNRAGSFYADPVTGERANNYVGCIMMLYDASGNPTKSYAFISTMVIEGDGRARVTLDRALALATAFTTGYRISYCHPDTKTLTSSDPRVAVALMLWDSYAFRAIVERNRCERQGKIIATAGSNNEVYESRNYFIVSGGFEAVKIGGGEWVADGYIGMKAGGATNRVSPFHANNVTIGYASTNSQSCVTRRYTNDSGIALNHGDVVAIKSDYSKVGLSGGSGSLAPHGVVFNPGGDPIANGNIVEIAIAGQCDVAFTANTTTGYLVVQAVGQTAQLFNPDTATVAQASRAFAKCLDTRTITGGTRTLVRCKIMA